jgi:hypothetical protein
MATGANAFFGLMIELVLLGVGPGSGDTHHTLCRYAHIKTYRNLAQPVFTHHPSKVNAVFARRNE